VGYQQYEDDTSKAIQSMEKAVELDSSDARLYYELDLLYERGGIDLEKRRAFLEPRRSILKKRDDALSRLVLVYVQTQAYDEAIEILENHHFNVWEGSRGLRDAYVDAYLLRGLGHFGDDRLEASLADYSKALEFPLNLENAWPYRGGRIPEIYYFIATAQEALGRREQAMEDYRKSVAAKQREEWSDLRYYEALALRKLGRDGEANTLLEGLMTYASAETGAGVGFFSKFGEKEPLNVQRSRSHYLRGLYYLSQERREEAKAEFSLALSLDINNLWARVQLGLFETGSG
jgi:tetratricopeptide (TPR) repeat protein